MNEHDEQMYQLLQLYDQLHGDDSDLVCTYYHEKLQRWILQREGGTQDFDTFESIKAFIEGEV